MRLFLSYARVDKPYCSQVADTLDVHEVWYDQRLYAGQDWWKEILRRLDWCEGFIYLLSPDSVASDYCRKEFEVAKMLGRPIFPVIVRPNTLVPDALLDLQYIDLSRGLDTESVKILLNSIYVAERHQSAARTVATIADEAVKQPPVNSVTVIRLAATAMENGQYDQAVFLLKQAKANGYESKYINIDAILKEAEAALERQVYLVEAEREYQQILDLVSVKATRIMGLQAFDRFRRDFPNFDPENLAQYGASLPKLLLPGNNPQYAFAPQSVLPTLELADVPFGVVEVVFNYDGKQKRKEVAVQSFRIGKYPVTNAQYQIFIEDPSGYCNAGWWQFSDDAYDWRMNHPQPQSSRFKGDERPREMVSWYDSLAFCNWLTSRTGLRFTLPTAAQWQRAFQGDDKRRYPWGDEFEPDRCNSAESAVKMTTIVTRYPKGASAFGVYDMAGNTWEWCIDSNLNSMDPLNVAIHQKRIVRGGSFMSSHKRALVDFHYELEPESYHASIGFRIVQNF